VYKEIKNATKTKKHNYDRALFRLIGIIRMLLKDERPTIKSLAIEFNVSIRTIQKRCI
jgi:predicted DNA-binding transcriptional regulator YafY